MTDHTTLTAVGEHWATAERTGDVPTLSTLLHEDFRGVGPLGYVLPKQAWLARYASGDLAHTRFDWEIGEIRTFGDTAVVIGVQTQETTYQGRPIENGRLRLTQVLTRHEDTWTLISLHISNLAEPPPAG